VGASFAKFSTDTNSYKSRLKFLSLFHKYFNTALLQNSKVKKYIKYKKFTVQDIKMTRVKDSEKFAWNFVVDFEFNTRIFSFSGSKRLRMLILL
jgi:hypothetical protein